MFFLSPPNDPSVLVFFSVLLFSLIARSFGIQNLATAVPCTVNCNLTPIGSYCFHVWRIARALISCLSTHGLPAAAGSPKAFPSLLSPADLLDNRCAAGRYRAAGVGSNGADDGTQDSTTDVTTIDSTVDAAEIGVLGGTIVDAIGADPIANVLLELLNGPSPVRGVRTDAHGTSVTLVQE